MLLGKLLLQLRLVTPVQLDAALRAQVAHGGRLGTNLLRLGYIEPDSLTAALAKQLDVRGVSMQRLCSLDELTLKRIPPSVARRNRALPLGLVEEGGRRSLCVAFADPRDLSCIDEVAFACGLPVVPFVAPELCLTTYLEEYYSGEDEGYGPNDGQMQAPQGQYGQPGQRAQPGQQQAQPGQQQAQPGHQHAQPGQHAPQQNVVPMAAAGGGASVVPIRPQFARPEAPRQAPGPQQFWGQGAQQGLANGAAPQGMANVAPQHGAQQGAQQGAQHGVPGGGVPTLPPLRVPAPLAPQDERGQPSGAMDVDSAPQGHPPAGQYTLPPPNAQQPWEVNPRRNTAPRSARSPTPAPPQRESSRESSADRPELNPLQFGLPNPVEEAKRPPAPVHSGLELDAPRQYREEDVDLPVQKPQWRELDEEAFMRPATSPAPPMVPSDDAQSRRRQPSEEVDMSDVGAREQPEASRAQRKSPPSAPKRRPALGARAAIARLEEAGSREEVGDIVVDYLRSGYACGFVFICRDDLCLGWKGFASGVTDAVIESLVLPLSTPSMLQVAHQRGSLFFGAPPSDGHLVQDRLWRMTQMEPPDEVLVLPVKLGSRVINLIYAQPFEGSELTNENMREINTLGKAMREAFTRLIKSKKQP